MHTRFRGKEVPKHCELVLNFDWKIERYNKLKSITFIELKFLDSRVSQRGRVVTIIRLLSQHGGWDRLLSTEEEVMRKLTLKFFSTFRLKHNNWSLGANDELMF